MVLVLAIVYTSLILAVLLTSALVGYSIYMCYKLRKSLEKKRLWKEKGKLDKNGEVEANAVKMELETKSLCLDSNPDKNSPDEVSIPLENIKLSNNVAYSHVTISKD